MSNRSVGSRIEAQWLPTARGAGLLFLLLVAGCGAVDRKPPKTGVPQGEMAAIEPSISHSTDQSDAKAPAKVPVPAVPVTAQKQQAASPLDLTTLEKRLKETDAIGVFTKIALKNQVDDLLDQFRAHYQGRATTTLVELRQPYDMLLLKVLSLLQDRDPSLARMVVTSREAIWGILADPVKFATI